MQKLLSNFTTVYAGAIAEVKAMNSAAKGLEVNRTQYSLSLLQTAL